MIQIIEAAWDNRELLKDKETVGTIEQVIEDLDKGSIRVAEPSDDGWQVNEWIKKAVILYFPTRQMETMEAGQMEFHEKINIKLVMNNWE